MEIQIGNEKKGVKTLQLDVFEHSDGRRWIRLNGKIIAEGKGTEGSNGVSTLAREYYRKLGTSLVGAAEIFNTALKLPIQISHPYFVRPLEY